MKKIFQDTKKIKYVEIVCLCLASVVTVALYANILHGEFLFDDLRLILDNPNIRLTELSLHSLAKVLQTTRPVAMLSIALNYYFCEYDVVGYHLFNIGVHVLTGVGLYYFLKLTLQLSEKTYSIQRCFFLAFATTLLWLVHPVQTQSVSYIIQRMNGLAGLFYIFAILFYVHGRVRFGWLRWGCYISCAVSFVLALGSKEMAITLPFFIVLYEWYFFQNLSFPWLKKALVAVTVGGCVGVGLLTLFPEFVPMGILTKGYSLYDFTLEQRLLTEMRVVVYYLSLLVFPHPNRLNLDYDFPLSYSMGNPWTTTTAGITLLLLVLMALFCAKKYRLYSFAILWFLGNLVIESTVIPLDLVMEHRIYLPSMMILFMGVVLFSVLVRYSYVQMICFCLCVSLLSFWTYERNKVWQSPLTLMVDAAQKSPHKARPAYNVACEFAKAGDAKRAVYWLRRSVGQETFNRWDLIKYDKDLKNIRQTQEFKDFYVDVVPID